MVHVTTFLLRWLYINNLIRDRAEIQSLPHHPPHMQQIQQQHNHQHGGGGWNVHDGSNDGGEGSGPIHASPDPDGYSQGPPRPPSTGQHDQHQQQGGQYHQYQQIPSSPPPPYSTPTASGLASTPPAGQQHYGRTQQPLAHPPHARSTAPPRQFQPHAPHSNQPHNVHSQHHQHHHHQQQQQRQLPNSAVPAVDEESEWRHRALRYVSAYPPGVARLYALDGLRLELILQLRKTMEEADRVGVGSRSGSGSGNVNGIGGDKGSIGGDGLKWGTRRRPTAALEDDGESANEDGRDEDHEQQQQQQQLDADSDILDEFEAATTSPNGSQPSAGENLESEDSITGTDRERIRAARSLRLETREYLPQLVASVLHSPPALTEAANLDPLSSLRSLLIDRCLIDPNLGIQLCWLLEAEVGRTWKTLFEHRQRTGRRLIVVLPAEKAAVLAKIGTEKRAAFDLLQDAEQATAFGCRTPGSGDDAAIGHNGEVAAASVTSSPPRLPSALSQRRCSHYGDCMHFMDRLTQISLDLRRVPALQRMSYLKESLAELNRRLRRRMFTRGEVSLDVEDNRGAYDWPTIEDINLDMLKYSVHLPLEPKSVTWPIGHDDDEVLFDPTSKHGTMRVLNIVADDARIMASRERCPFLVHLEVAETGLEGNDARLYAAGVKDASVTLEEAMGIRGVSGRTRALHPNDGGFAPYQVPTELLSSSGMHRRQQEEDSDDADTEEESSMRSATIATGKEVNLSRGGWQGDGDYYYPANAGTWDDYGVPSPYEMVRQEEIQELHDAMQDRHNMNDQSQVAPQASGGGPYAQHGPMLSTGKALLDKVYGQPWEIRCSQIRKTSSYGKVKGWRLASFLMKAGEDIRREALVMQIISKMKIWFDSEIPEEHRPYLRPYTIMCIGGDAGVVECVHDAKSVDEVKKQTDGYTTLRNYFERAFGPPGSPTPPTNSGGVTFEKAQDNFLRSLVGYSLVCYVLQIKDRHNANILMSREGHLMHIDFGFVLGDTPKMGKVPLFSERAPFKLTQEFWDVLGGWNFNEGGLGVKFCKMFEATFACASAHADEIASLIEAAVLNLTWDANEARNIGNGVRSRLRMIGAPNSVRQKAFIMDLVEAALTSWGTSTYDWLQKSMNGYQ